MTNFEPIKNEIWNSVKSDNKVEFNKQCNALMEKAVGDWWRLGWNLAPKDVNEIIELCKNLSKSAHELWVKAMECGDAPHEDISPGESFLRIANMIETAVSNKTINDNISK